MAGWRLTKILCAGGLCLVLSGWCLGVDQSQRQTLERLNATIQQNPRQVDAYLYRGLIYQDRGEFERARTEFEIAIELDPHNADAYSLRAIVWQELGKLDKAEADFSRAIKLDPQDASNYFLRGILRRQRGELKLAIADWNETLRLEPQNAEALMHRALALGMQEKFEGALKDCAAALRADPQLYPVWQLQAWIRGTCPQSKFRDGPRAVMAARKACELSDWQDSLAIETLAAAYAESGDFKSALRYQNKAMTMLRPGSGPVADARLRLKLYESQKPFRDVTP
ncbi:MAG: tetratricopeptide repeat protein [Planctomycetes bacterium]|nr:tetratricopeptide repeat protein [Planctomycetota bacterium]